MKDLFYRISFTLFVVCIGGFLSCTKQDTFHGVHVGTIESNIKKSEKMKAFDEIFPDLNKYESSAEVIAQIYHLNSLLVDCRPEIIEAHITYLLSQKCSMDNVPADLYKIESLINHLKNVNLAGYADDMVQINTVCYVEELLNSYTAEYYKWCIGKCVDAEMEFAWNNYEELADMYFEKYKLVCRQLEMLGDGGTLPSCVYNDFYLMRIEECKEFAHMLIDEIYISEDKSFRRISDADMRDLYQSVRDNLAFLQNSDVLMTAIVDEEQAWFSLMEARLGIYYKLHGMCRSSFANATNRMQARHVETLKSLFAPLR